MTNIQEGLVIVKVRKILKFFFFLRGQQGSSLPIFFVFSLYEEGYNMYRLQGSQSQKAEKGNALREILTPTSKGFSAWL
jgi:hypothetical protein